MDGGERINSYGLVSYIPDPLGTFLDGLRRELIASCMAQSHVSVLPPRALDSEADAEAELAAQFPQLAPFELELGEVELFESTSVIFIGVRAGFEELRYIHARLNQGRLASNEINQYHPHITLAQDFPPAEVETLLRLARERWAQFPAGRRFRIDRLTLVQNTLANCWVDLVEFPLGRTRA